MNAMGETDFFSHFRDVRRRGDSEWWAKCPAHDDTDASLHFTRKDGRIVFKCFGGCTGDAVIRAVGLKWSDVPGAEQRHPRPRREAWGCTLADYARAKMFPEEMLREFCCSDRQYTSGKGNAFPSVAMEYRGEDGRTLVTRYRMSIGKGNLPRFLWEKGRTPVLYGLWRQPEEKKAIILVEGESDCHALWCGGVPAMGVPGASNYQAAWDTVLDAYKRIYIHLEKDNGGEALFNAFAGDGAGKAPSPLLGKIRFFILPQEVKDPSDLWCRTKGDRVLFALAIKEAVKHAETADRIRKRPPGGWTGKGKGVPLKREDRARPSAENGAKGGRPSADYAGLAMAYYQQCAQRDGVAVLRIWRNEWYQWDGRKYIHVADADVKAGVSSWMQKDGHAADFACQASRNAVENALLNLSVPEMCWISSRTPMHSWASTGESAAGWRAMSNCLLNLEKAAEIPSLVREGGEAPADLLEDVRKPLSPDFFSVLAMDYPYDPAAECPKFMSWLKSTQPDQEVQEAIQMMMGLLLVPDTSYNVCFMFAGEAGCGKSTFLDIIRGFIGVENTCRVPLLSFDNRFATWQLTERLVNIVGEMVTSDPQGRLRYIEGDFKDSVSGGDVHVEKKGKDPFSAPCTARHVFATNSLPVFFDRSEAIWDRLRIIPFTQRFRYTASEIRDYAKIICDAELPGVFNFALDGLRKLRQRRNFPEPAACAIAKDKHRRRCDIEGTYVKTYYTAGDTDNPFRFISAYQAFQEFLRSHGLSQRSSQTFQDAMLRVFPECRITPGDLNPEPVVHGIRPLFYLNNTTSYY